MRFAINDPDEDQPIRLSLAVDRRGTSVEVQGVMPDGMVFNIIAFHEDGTFSRRNALPADAGFQLTDSDEYGSGRKIVERDNSPNDNGEEDRVTAAQILVVPHFNPEEENIEDLDDGDA